MPSVPRPQAPKFSGYQPSYTTENWYTNDAAICMAYLLNEIGSFAGTREKLWQNRISTGPRLKRNSFGASAELSKNFSNMYYFYDHMIQSVLATLGIAEHYSFLLPPLLITALLKHWMTFGYSRLAAFRQLCEHATSYAKVDRWWRVEGRIFRHYATSSSTKIGAAIQTSKWRETSWLVAVYDMSISLGQDISDLDSPI
jgi:hypothetical protein